MIETNDDLWGSTEGLCGNYDANPYDDFSLPAAGESAASVDELAEAWRSPNVRCKADNGGGGGGDPCGGDQQVAEAATMFCNKLLTLRALKDCRLVNYTLTTVLKVPKHYLFILSGAESVPFL